MWVSELGMYFYKARAYSPTLGRFMQTDPIGYGDGMNWYAYTHNDPVNYVDPMGLVTIVRYVQVCITVAEPPHEGQSAAPAPTCGLRSISTYVPDPPNGSDQQWHFAQGPQPWTGGSPVSNSTKPAQTVKHTCGASPPPKTYPVPKGYHSLFDQTGRMMALNGTNTPIMNPNYQRVINSTHFNWRGIGEDFLRIAAGTFFIVRAGEIGSLSWDMFDVDDRLRAAGLVAGSAVKAVANVSSTTNRCPG